MEVKKAMIALVALKHKQRNNSKDHSQTSEKCKENKKKSNHVLDGIQKTSDKSKKESKNVKN